MATRKTSRPTHARVAGAALAVTLAAACDRSPAPAAPPTTTTTTAIAAPPSTAPPAPPPPPETHVAPSSCAPAGPARTLLSIEGARSLRVDSVTLGSPVAAVVFFEGTSGRLLRVDASGEAIGDPIPLTDPGQLDGSFHVRANGDALDVVYADYRSRAQTGIDLVARTIGATGELGPKVVLDHDVPFGWADAWDVVLDEAGVLLVEANADQDGVGPGTIDVRFGPVGGPLARAAHFPYPFAPSPPGDTPASTSLSVARTPEGYAIGWSAGNEAGTRAGTQALDGSGAVRGESTPLALDGALPRWIDGAWIAERARGGHFETASVPVTSESTWTPVTAPAPVTRGRLVALGGRTWARLDTCVTDSCSPIERVLVPLSASREAMGPPVALGRAGELAIGPDGRGALVTAEGGTLTWQSLACR